MSEALNIIRDETLTYHQELIALARLGESTDHALRYSDAYYEAKAKGGFGLIITENYNVAPNGHGGLLERRAD